MWMERARKRQGNRKTKTQERRERKTEVYQLIATDITAKERETRREDGSEREGKRDTKRRA